MKILIIDDEDDTRCIASLSLGLLGGVEVIEANNGPDGICKAQTERPDAILLDMIMPDMDGADTITALRNNPCTMHIPVIFITTKGLSTDIERMKALGAKGVVIKPFDPQILATQVRSILSL